MKTHWKKLVNPDYLGAYSLGDMDSLTVTIEKVVREMITGTGGKKEECTVAYMKGQKPMILNNTNAKSIQKIYDTPFIEEWAGKRITLYVAKIKAFGETGVECLRIKQEKPAKEELKPAHPKWDGAIKSIKAGTVTIEQVEKTYSITPENKKLLCQK